MSLEFLESFLLFHGSASIWEHEKRKVATETNSYKRYRDILFQKVASGYLLHFVQDGSSKKRSRSSSSVFHLYPQPYPHQDGSHALHRFHHMLKRASRFVAVAHPRIGGSAAGVWRCSRCGDHGLGEGRSQRSMEAFLGVEHWLREVSN